MCWVLTSSQVRRGSQVGKVIQADDVNDGADHSRMVLCEEEDRQEDTLSLTQHLNMIEHFIFDLLKDYLYAVL